MLCTEGSLCFSINCVPYMWWWISSIFPLMSFFKDIFISRILDFYLQCPLSVYFPITCSECWYFFFYLISMSFLLAFLSAISDARARRQGNVHKGNVRNATDMSVMVSFSDTTDFSILESCLEHVETRVQALL